MATAEVWQRIPKCEHNATMHIREEDAVDHGVIECYFLQHCL